MQRLANLGFKLVLGLALVTLSGGQTHARNSKHPAALPALNINNFSQTGTIAKPPIGWTQLCSTKADDCENPAEIQTIELSQVFFKRRDIRVEVGSRGAVLSPKMKCALAF